MDISVFITSYNQKAWLVEALESVLAQTLPPSQIVIADDASQDGSQAVIAAYTARYPDLIKAVYHTQNQGVARTRRDALTAVTGTYVTYLDGDDRFLPGKLEQEMALLQARSDVEIVFSNSRYISADGRCVGTWITNTLPPQGNVFRQTFVRDFPRRNLFRMELLPLALWRQVGFHDPEMPLLEDWEMRIRLTQRLRIAYCDAILSDIRVHRQGLSSAAAERKLAALELLWCKNYHLLESLDVAEREVIRQGLDGWRARFLREQAKAALSAYGGSGGGRRVALAAYRQSCQYRRHLDLDLLLGFILPRNLYTRLRAAARRRWGQGDGR